MPAAISDSPNLYNGVGWLLRLKLQAGVPSLESLQPASGQLLGLPALNTAPSRALQAVLDIICRQRGRFLPLLVRFPLTFLSQNALKALQRLLQLLSLRQAPQKT